MSKPDSSPNLADRSSTAAEPREIPALLALTPLLAFSDSLALSLAAWLLLLLVSVFGATLFALARKLSPSLPLYSELPLGFILYSLVTGLVLSVVGSSHFTLLREADIYFSLLGCSAFTLIEAPWLSCRLWPATEAKPPALLSSLKLGVMTLLRYGSVFLLFALLRELLYTGTLMRDWQLLVPFNLAAANTAIYTGSSQWMPLAGTVAGGFMLLALLVAAWQWLRQIKAANGSARQEPVKPAARARVTEQL